ncbi:transcriptional regulator [Arenibacter sp. M-2]|uniref:GbsR/MarR family transcriptional regulator n=1 Tax=unclassified Arenibacter TaxID=2615047 RepID=UPI000D774055|nr:MULTISPECIES: transcriptional regulator [unclassified Arenibacter]MDL5510560.1 transcriptional regulator [Arenibacter sp. M-2]PXX31407.1 DNA-binding transcriptional regulator GbsR (MarR family) [Arenibacter sp. ARW7G5Y1]|tara:strand:- start:10545 stop:11048 length:504 start_codon:yes stop_codon:yes gene_type:complete
MKNNICKQKMALVEKLGVHLEGREQLAPVAARIMAYIILTGKKGSTFEDMVTILCASKSTISTHLNHLQDLNKIEYYTKTGDRKKYFIINKNTIIQHVDRMISHWNAERAIHLEIKAYKENQNKLKIENDDEKFDLSFHNDYVKFVDEATSSVKELREKLISNKFHI